MKKLLLLILLIYIILFFDLTVTITTPKNEYKIVYNGLVWVTAYAYLNWKYDGSVKQLDFFWIYKTPVVKKSQSGSDYVNKTS